MGDGALGFCNAMIKILLYTKYQCYLLYKIANTTLALLPKGIKLKINTKICGERGLVTES